MFTNFLYLLFTHFMADFAFQSDFMSKFKYRLPYVMFVHCFIWTFALYAMSDLLDMNVSLFIWIFMFVIHYSADWGKCYTLEKKYTDSNGVLCEKSHTGEIKRLFYIDQATHIIQVLTISLF